jgi:hypothetical protein
VLPFAKLFEERVLRHHQEIASGKGFVSGMGENFFSHVEAMLTPVDVEVGPPKRIPPHEPLDGAT